MASPSKLVGSKRDWEVSEMEEAKGVYVNGIPVNVSPGKRAGARRADFIEAHLCETRHEESGGGTDCCSFE